MATGDLIITENKLGIGASDNLSTLTVRPKASFNLTGSVSKAVNSTAVTGTSTRFLSELAVGDRISVGDSLDATKAVVAIASDTLLTVESAYTDTETDPSPSALPSMARFDGADGTPQVVVNDSGNVGVGTMAPNAALDVSGSGAGNWRGCDVSLRVHLPEYSDAWQMVMSTDAGGPDAGVAIWLYDQGNGAAALVFTLVDSEDDEVDALRLDGTGLTMQGGLAVTPGIVAADYALAGSDYYLYVDAGAAGQTVTLPSAIDYPGKVFYIHKVAGAGAVTIVTTSPDTINGAASKSISTLYEGIKTISMTSPSGPYVWFATVQPAV